MSDNNMIEKYLTFFESKGIDTSPYRKRKSGNTTCPQCGKKSRLFMYTKKGVAKCGRENSCGFMVSYWDSKKGGSGHSTPKPIPKKNLEKIDPRVVEWAKTRGISETIAKLFKLQISRDGNITFPYFLDEKLVNYKIRKVNKEGKKFFQQHPGALKVPFNVDSIKKGIKKAIWVEGETDALSIAEAGLYKEFAILSLDQGASSPGQNVDGKFKCLDAVADKLDQIEEHYLFLDGDMSGIYTQRMLIQRLGPHKCKIVEHPQGHKDANEILTDPNYSKDLNKEAIRLAISNAKPHVPIGVIDLDETIMSEMMAIKAEGWARGKKTGISDLDGIYTYLRGEMTFFMGWPNSGKGTITRFLAMLSAIKYGWKWGIFAPEDGGVKMLITKLMNVYVGKNLFKPFEIKNIDQDKYEEALIFVKNHFFFINPPRAAKVVANNEWINSQIEYLRLQKGVNCFLKDPWFKIKHDEGKRTDIYLTEAMDTELEFCRNYDACFYTDHPLKPGPGKTMKSAPDPGQQRGGGTKYMSTDNFAIVHRAKKSKGENADDSRLVTLSFTKIRNQEQVGIPGKVELVFDTEKQRFHPKSMSAMAMDYVEAALSSKNIDDIVEAQVQGDDNEMRIDDDLPF